MEERIARIWMNKLNSGIVQGKDFLFLGGRYSAYGVLCLIYEEDTDNNINYTGEITIPLVVLEWAGIKDINIPVGRYKSLVHANDCGVSFVSLAGWIKQNWKIL